MFPYMFSILADNQFSIYCIINRYLSKISGKLYPEMLNIENSLFKGAGNERAG